MTGLTLPSGIRQLIEGYEQHELVRRKAPNRIVLLDAPGRVPLILKIGRNLDEEAKRISWLEGKIAVPEVIDSSRYDDVDYLLMSRLPGVDGTDADERMDTARFIEQLAIGMRMFHSIPIDECPFVEPLSSLMDVAEDRVRRRVVEADQFAPQYLGRSPDDLLESLRRLQPPAADLVVTHGDPSLPNVMFEDDTLTGFIDLGLACVSDPYRDLAIVARTVTWNLGGRWVRPFFEAYGVSADPLRIQFFQLLDEFVMARPV